MYVEGSGVSSFPLNTLWPSVFHAHIPQRLLYDIPTNLPHPLPLYIQLHFGVGSTKLLDIVQR